MYHIIHEIIGDGAGLLADDAQNRLAAMQPTGAVTLVLACSMERTQSCPDAQKSARYWMEPELQRHHQL